MKYAIVFFSLVLCFITGCFSGNDIEKVSPLLGVWTTEQQPYDNSSWEIKPEGWIIFKNALEHQVHYVKEIEAHGKGNCTKYVIHYGDRTTGDFVLSLYYFSMEHKDIVTFENQEDIIWTRADQ